MGIYRNLEILPGVQPLTDATALSSRHWRNMLHCRFVDGFLQKIGGWIKAFFFQNETVKGVPRTLYNIELLQRPNLIIGTNTRLYSENGGKLTNITPFQTTTVAAANSLSTQYGALTANPFTFTNTSNRIVVADTENTRFQVGDSVTLSGATGTIRGIPSAQLNATHVIREMVAGGYAVRVASNATSTGTGGGTITRASGLIRVTTANTTIAGDRVKIANAAAVGGITAPQINMEFISRNNTAAYFDIMTAGISTSAATGGGGASTVYYNQIPAGVVDELALQGYGAGLYGVGLYGTALTSTSGRVYPRIWFLDRFGEDLIATPGNQSGIYRWDGVNINAPTLVVNAPLTVNYAFVSDNTLITFGADGIENRIATSDQGDITQWTSSSLNQVFRDDIEGAGRLISHLSVRGVNVLFTENEAYSFRKISREAGVWEIKQIDPNIGIISAMARVSVRGVGFFMGQKNFYMYRGANFEVIPSNNPQVPHCTALKYVFSNLNTAQKSKCFAQYNPIFDEVQFHYPSGASLEPDRMVRVNLNDYTWSIDMIDRTAAESPSLGTSYPRLADFNGNIYYHEVGNDADTVSLPWNATSPFMTITQKTATIQSFVPDSLQSGTVNVNLRSRQKPQSVNLQYNNNYSVTSVTPEVEVTVNGGYWDYTFSGNELDQSFRMGVWQEQLKESAKS